MIRRTYRRAAIIAITLLAAGPATANEVADFYAGKQIKMIMPTAPGGSTALYGTVLSEHMKRHIPGEPNIIHEYRTGGGGMLAANYVYNAAPRDGTIMTMLLSSVILSKHLTPASAKFELDDFSFIGRVADLPRALIAWHESGLNTIEDAKVKEVPLGASGRSSVTTIHPTLLNLFAGTRFRVVTGYQGAGDTYLALERGEIGATTVAWDGLVSNRGDWLREGKVKVLARIGDRKMPGYETVPRLVDLAANPNDRAVLELTLLPMEAGQAVAGPPEMPRARLVALQRAFDATMKDPQFLAEARKRQMIVEPMTGDELRDYFVTGAKQPAEVVERARKLTGLDK
jgi:tripartite-type tricarboxylate transporter receptor subunit TctC